MVNNSVAEIQLRYSIDYFSRCYHLSPDSIIPNYYPLHVEHFQLDLNTELLQTAFFMSDCQTWVQPSGMNINDFLFETHTVMFEVKGVNVTDRPTVRTGTETLKQFNANCSQASHLWNEILITLFIYLFGLIPWDLFSDSPRVSSSSVKDLHMSKNSTLLFSTVQ